MKRRFFSLAIAGVAALPLTTTSLVSSAHVAPPAPSQTTRIGGLAQVSVIDRSSGQALPLYRYRGEYWVAGTEGARYAVRIRNNSGARVMAVMSVDGVNVISGETAGIEQSGYVLDARERADIAGWRKSDAQIAAFEFAAPADSYASRTGRPNDLGVIGVAVFRERIEVPVPPPQPPVARNESRSKLERPSAEAADASASSSTKSMSPAPGLGTGHGQRETSHVGHTQFTRARSTPDDILRIRYDSRENLIAAGVIPKRPESQAASPSPFPASDAGYVPDPPRKY